MTIMTRRAVIGTGTASVALAAPGIVRGEAARTLRFIPHADLASLDPVWTTADIARNHGNMIYDQLFGFDAEFRPQPQMIDFYRVDSEGTTYEFTLREGLAFHDKTPVLARDCVASILRWGQRDAYGSVLLARADEVTAAADRVIRPAETTVLPVARSARATELRHDARARGEDRPEHPDHRTDRQRPVPFRRG
jgi:peptide/nickel transport system substrate-binding protein